MPKRGNKYSRKRKKARIFSQSPSIKSIAQYICNSAPTNPVSAWSSGMAVF
jgi:hypothetical protein